MDSNLNSQTIESPATLSGTSTVSGASGGSASSASVLAQELLALRQEHKDLQNQLKVQEEYLRYLWTGMDKVRRYIFWNYVGTVVKLLIIVIPLVALYIIAAPMLKQALQSWQSLQGNLNSVNNEININSILDTIQELK